MAYFYDKERIKKFDRLRIVYLVCFILAFALTEAGRYFYRPWVYQNDINDFGIADSMGNLGGVVVQIFFGMTVFNPLVKKGIRLIVFFVLGYIVYEFLQFILPKGTFDWKDVFGTLVGGFFGLILFSAFHLLKRTKYPDKFLISETSG
ncbi:MAG: hypothetical protein K9H16_11760 [Bacteroidales bacterium]|nr:hypothetical protein [Bacteroidales bacterium]